MATGTEQGVTGSGLGAIQHGQGCPPCRDSTLAGSGSLLLINMRLIVIICGLRFIWEIVLEFNPLQFES